MCYSELLCHRNTRKISEIRLIQILGPLSKPYSLFVLQKILNLRYPILQRECRIKCGSYIRNSMSTQSCCLSGWVQRNTSDTCTPWWGNLRHEHIFGTDFRDVQATELLGNKKYFRAFFWMGALRSRGVVGNRY